MSACFLNVRKSDLTRDPGRGAEPWSEALRGKLEEAWGGGFDACDIYGLSEVIGPGVAAECREALPQLEVHPELVEHGLDGEAVTVRLREQLEVRLVVGAPGSIPRQELGKAKRVFERTSERDELASARER